MKMEKNYWKEAVDKETKKAKIDYKPRENCIPEKVRKGKVYDIYGYQEITCVVIFDVKMDFTQKAILLDNGSTTEAPVDLNYSSVVSRDSVQL